MQNRPALFEVYRKANPIYRHKAICGGKKGCFTFAPSQIYNYGYDKKDAAYHLLDCSGL